MDHEVAEHLGRLRLGHAGPKQGKDRVPTSDVGVWLSFGVTAAMAAISVAWSQYRFSTGKKLKP
jgi:hypothetical protein